MACRRKRIALDQIDGFLERLQALPIETARDTPAEILGLPRLAQAHGLTNYDAAYIALALKLKVPLATTDNHVRRAALSAGVNIVAV